MTHDLLQVADFQGARIGIRPSHVSEMTFKALGATPVAIQRQRSTSPPWTASNSVRPPSLAIHTIGAPSPLRAISCSGLDQTWSSPTRSGSTASPRNQQGEIRAAAAATDTLSAAGIHGSAEEARNILCARHFSITSASRQALDAFHQKVQPVVDEMTKDPATKATIDAITALRGPVDAPDLLAPCPIAVATASPSTGPTPLDGTWKTSFTKADLVASPLLIDSGEINDENWGDMTMTFADGKFTGTQSNSFARSKSSGTFTIKGDAIYLAIDQTGERFAYRWSIYKNTLTFKRDETIGGGPTPSLVKPWTRVP